MGYKNGLSLILAVSIGVSSGAVFASSEEAPVEKRFGLISTLETSSNLYPVSSASHDASTTLQLEPTYKLGKDYTLGGVFVINKSLIGEQVLGVSNAVGLLIFPAQQLNPFLRLSPRVLTYLPLTTDGLNGRNSMILGARAAGRIYFDLAPAGLSVFTGLYELNFTKNFHSFKTTTAGDPNPEFGIGNRFILQANISTKFAFVSDFTMSNSWSYFGNLRNRFAWTESLEFAASPNLTLAASLSNTGATSRANGVDSNIKLLDSQTTQIAGSISYSY